MTFLSAFLVFMFGFAAGVLATALYYLARLSIEQRIVDPRHDQCPPCNHACRQGRDCPANKPFWSTP